MYGTVYVVMREGSREYSDTFTLSFNMFFFSTIKWVVLLPFFIIGFTMLYMKPVSLDSLLPTRGGVMYADYTEDWDEDEDEDDYYDDGYLQHAMAASYETDNLAKQATPVESQQAPTTTQPTDYSSLPPTSSHYDAPAVPVETSSLNVEGVSGTATNRRGIH